MTVTAIAPHASTHKSTTLAPCTLADVKVITAADGTQLVSVRDAARLQGLSPRTIYGWIRNGWVETRQVASGRMLIVVESLWLTDDDASTP